MATDRTYIIDLGRFSEMVSAVTQRDFNFSVTVDRHPNKGEVGLRVWRNDGEDFTQEQSAWLAAFSEGLEVGMDIALEGDAQV